VAKGPRS